MNHLKNLFLLGLFLLSCVQCDPAHATPNLVTDPDSNTPGLVDKCTVQTDGVSGADIAVSAAISPQTGNICNLDLAALLPGSHTTTLAFKSTSASVTSTGVQITYTITGGLGNKRLAPINVKIIH